jgi:ferredoxin
MRRRHYFLGEAAAYLYRACNDCNKRTPHVCTKCGLCYSCHWKIEITPLNQLRLVATTTATRAIPFEDNDLGYELILNFQK